MTEKAKFPKVEIIEYGDSDYDPETGGIVAGALRVNGVEFYCPMDSEILVEAGGSQLTQVTATFFVSGVEVVHRER